MASTVGGEGALGVVDGIAGALSGTRLEGLDPTLAGGLAGVALFHGYRAAICDDAESRGLADWCWERTVARAAAEVRTLGFFTGLTGIAWVGFQLHRLSGGRTGSLSSGELDGVLREVLESGWIWESDLVYGLAGVGAYALDHPSPSTARGLCEAVVEALQASSEERRRGVAWRTPAAFLSADLARRFPDGVLDLGMAHGQPGMIAFLARAAGEQDIDAARPLLAQTAAWLGEQAEGREHGGPIRFGEDTPSRSAWCYGDPGIAHALLAASRVLGDGDGAARAWRIARRAVAREPASTGVVDGGLCHGAAGLAHLYDGFHRVSGEAPFRHAAAYWLERLADFRQPDAWPAGVASWWPEEQRWVADPGFLSGAAGIGLVLLSTLSPQPLGWDRPLMLSPCPSFSSSS